MEKLKCKVVMLPTEKSRLGRNGIYIHYENSELTKTVSYIPQHLYFTSEREIKNDAGDLDIKMNDVVIDIKDQVVGKVSHIGGPWYFKGTLQFPQTDDLRINRHCSFNCYKVIASTDPSLGIPLIPQSFIEKYVEEQGKIDEVMIEMINENEELFNGFEWWIPKVRKDNTVIVSKVKDSWNRQEVVELIQKYNSDFKVFEDNEQWIKENL